MKITVLIISIILLSACHAEDVPSIDPTPPVIDNSPVIIDHPIAGNLLDPYYLNKAADTVRNWFGEQSIVEQEQYSFLNDYNDTCLNCTTNVTA